MICRVTGRVASAAESAAVVEVNGIGYEVLMPAAAAPDLIRLTGEEVTLYTVQYLEGNPAVGNLVPRLIGFLSEPERDFFHEFVKVRGVSMRRALRAMSVPVHQIAAAIENGDVRTLATLPDIGKKTAALLVTELRGKLQRFVVPTAGPTPVRELTDAQKIALEILVQWGDRRVDAVRWIAAAVEEHPELGTADEIVRAAYRIKQRAVS